MKIESLKISGYKNLKNRRRVSFNLKKCGDYTALIGLNGSGKSNILEAISLIFSSLYHNRKINFYYEIIYKLDDNYVKVDSGGMMVKNNYHNAYNVIPKLAYEEYLPDNVITSYSGEELRMWEEIYFESYQEFFNNLKKQSFSIPKLLYINKYSWEFALIALLCSDNKSIKNFINNILGIQDDVYVEFDIDDSNYDNYPNNEALSFIKRLNGFRLEQKSGKISIETIKSMDIGQKNNDDFTRKVFYYLFVTGMPVKSKKINADKIIRETKIHFNKIDIKKLSEGEKKMILIYAITHLLSDNKTLVLLDEPDAHLHIERKKEIIDIINSQNCFTIFTTHSPKILNSIDDKNIKLVKNLQDNQVKILKLDKVEVLSRITNGEFTITDATLAMSTSKDILLVEGKDDCNYIKKAIEKLAPDYDGYSFHIINCGGADNVPTFLEQSLFSLLNSNQLCICTFDHDKQGIINYNKILDIANCNNKNNIKAMYHPKVDKTEHKKGIDFYIEDYFPVESYKTKIIEVINNKDSFKKLQEYRKPKSIIEDNYKKFEKSYFENFKVFLDKTLEIKDEFHKSKT